MALTIKQLVIRGEVIEEPARLGRGQELTYEQVKQLIEAAKKDIEREYLDKISEMIENTAAR